MEQTQPHQKELEERRKRLQEKKQQLEALRKQREEQQRKLKEYQSHSQSKPGSATAGATGSLQEKEAKSSEEEQHNDSLDSYIETLLKAPVPGQKENEQEKLLEEAIQRLTLTNETAITSIAPVIRDNYERSVQTDLEFQDIKSSQDQGTLHHDQTDSMEQGTKVEVGTQVEKGQNFAEWIKQLKKTPEEVKAETQSDSFKQFLDKVTRPMERALDTAVYGDFLQDLLMSSDRNNSNQDSTSGRNQNLWHAMSLSSQESKGNFNAAGEDKIKTPTIDQTAKSYLSQRCITQIQPYTGESDEYVLAAYRHSLPSISQTPQTYQFSAERLESLSKQVGGYIPGGVAAIWNLKAPSVPERLWHCSSEITCILRHPGNRGCVIGGLKNGQIVRWDTSANGVPVESSALLQEKGHFSAIYGMHMTGLDSSSATLVTIGEDGFLCSWSPNHLIEPIMQTELLFRPTEKDIKLGKQFADSVVGHVMGHVLYETDYDVSPGAISFPREDSGTVYIGGEDGCIYVGTISNRAVQLTTRLLGHTSPVRIIRHHPGIVGEDNISADSKTASDTFISAGFEWKVNIWSPKLLESPISTWELPYGPPTDIQWCPHNPSIFAVGDGSGRIHLFDVFREDFSPFVTEVVSNYGITTIQWSQKRRQIYVGDSSGELSIWNVRPDRLRSRHDVQPSLSSLMDFLQSRAKQQSTSTAEIATL